MTNKDKADLEELKKAFDEIIYMAIRYAHLRKTFAPSIVRDACRVRAKMGGFELKDDTTLEPFQKGIGACPSDSLIDLIEAYGPAGTKKIEREQWVDKVCRTCGWNDRKHGSPEMCANPKWHRGRGMCKDACFWKPIPKKKQRQKKESL